MKRRIGENDDSVAAESLIQSYGWKHLVVLAGGDESLYIHVQKIPFMSHVLCQN